jgi:hypothetical protein
VPGKPRPVGGELHTKGELSHQLFDPKPDGPDAGKRIFEQGDFKKAIELLCAVIGCDPENGRPQWDKLMELGLHATRARRITSRYETLCSRFFHPP